MNARKLALLALIATTTFSAITYCGYYDEDGVYHPNRVLRRTGEVAGDTAEAIVEAPGNIVSGIFGGGAERREERRRRREEGEEGEEDRRLRNERRTTTGRIAKGTGDAARKTTRGLANVFTLGGVSRAEERERNQRNNDE